MSSVEPLGQRSLQDYDALNRLTRSTDALGQSLNYAYDANGNLLSHTDARGNVTRYTYTASGQVASKQDALLATETNLYEAGGKLRQRIDRKGQLSAITRDVLGRVKTIGFGASAGTPTAYQSTVTLTWDAADRLTQIVDRSCANPSISLNCATVASTRTITRTYDALDRMTQEVSPQGEVNYSYDAGGRKTGMTVKNGAPGAQTTQPAITYTYDNADRLTGISQAAGATNANQAQAIVFAYDAGGRRTRTTLANGSTVTYTYDVADQLIAMEHRKSDGTLLGDLSYSYDANGRRTGMGGSLAGISLPTDTTDASYNANNQLTRWNGQTYAYDANGNLTGDGASSYQWDEKNQLKAITGAATASFQYDAFGRRSGKTIASTTTGFVYGGLIEDNLVQELDGTLNTSSLRATTISAGIDEALLREEGPQLLSALIDANNHTVQLSDQTQTKTVGYSYEAYGKSTADATTSTNSQQYTGRENDNPGTANGLYYYRARYYMPGCGRFISEDPIGWASGQANNYAYVGGDPVSTRDAYGLAASCSVDSGGTKNITIPITYSGPGASPGVTSAMNSAIESNWSVPGYKFSVTRGRDNRINVPEGVGVSHVFGVGGSTGNWYAGNDPWVAAHEAGHLMGLGDQYDEVPGSSPRRTVARSGFEGTVMAVHLGVVTDRDRAAAASWAGCK